MANDEMKARHPQCPEEICGRHQGRGACSSCEALEGRDRFVWLFSREGRYWLLWDFSGAHAIWRKVVPPDPTDEATQREPPTFFLWFLGIYIASAVVRPQLWREPALTHQKARPPETGTGTLWVVLVPSPS